MAATSGDIVVLARDITALGDGWLDPVRDALAGRDTGLVSAVLEAHGSPGGQLAGLEFVDELLNCRWRQLADRTGGRRIEVPLVSSSFLAVRRATLTYLGGLDTGMTSDAWHDVELSVRSSRCGFRCVVLEDVVAQWRPPPPPAASAFVHDLLRVAAVHLEQVAFAALLSAMRDSPQLNTALGRVLTSDVGARRARLAPLMDHPVDLLLPAPASSPERAKEQTGKRAS